MVLIIGGIIWWSWNITSKIDDIKPIEIPPQPKNVDIEPIDDSDDWRTYRNEDIGIEFQYPKEFRYTTIFQETEKGSTEITFSELNTGLNTGIHFAAYTSNYEAFKEYPFTGDENIASRCPQYLIYDEGGDVCKIIEVAGEKAVLENRLFEDECSIALNTRIYFNNHGKSIYKGLLFSLYLYDVNEKVSESYDCSEEGSKISYIEAVNQSMNIMEEKNLSEKDQYVLDIFNQILSTFRFIK